MDTRAEYRDLIKRILTKYATLAAGQPLPGVETLLAIDGECDQYLRLQAGWSERRRLYGITVHVRSREGKIWVEQDWTEDGIATDLIQAGVLRDDIVLAFHEPAFRSSADLVGA